MESLAKFFNHDFFEEGSLFELYDNNGNRVYYEDAIGNCIKIQYKKDSHIIFAVTSEGYWWKQEYDNNNNLVYYKNSKGVVTDNRPKCENKTVVIDGIEYELRRK